MTQESKTIFELDKLVSANELDQIPIARPSVPSGNNKLELGDIIKINATDNTVTLYGSFVIDVSNIRVVQSNIVISTEGTGTGNALIYVNGLPQTSGTTVQSGDAISLAATANPGSVFVQWVNAANNEPLSDNPNYSFTFSANSPTSIKAVFSVHNTYDLIATLKTTNAGAVSSSDAVVEYRKSNNGAFTPLVSGVQVKIEEGDYLEIRERIITTAKYKFNGWEGSHVPSPATSSTIIINSVSGDVNLGAVFQIQTYTIYVNAVNGSVRKGGDIYSGETCEYGTSIQVVATASSSEYLFEHWKRDNVIESSATESRTIMVTGNYTYTAVFSTPDYYVGFCDNDSIYTGYSDQELINNARGKNIVSKVPNYPSSSTYVYFEGSEKLMYLLFDSSLIVKIDVDNEGTSFDLPNQTYNQIHMPALSRSDVQLNGKTYKVLATYDATNTSANGYRFKFSN